MPDHRARRALPEPSDEEDMVDDLLRPAQVARLLGVSRTWLYDAAKTGRIPSVRIGGPGGPVRFVREDLEAWLDDARRNRFTAARAGSVRGV